MGKKKKKDLKLEQVPLIPGPGSVLKRDGSWLEPQPGGGYLLREGGAGGAPPAKLRERMRGHVSERMHVAGAILDDDTSKPRDQLAALDLLLKYGLGTRSDKFDADLIKALALAVQAEVKEKETLLKIEKRWASVLRQHVTGN